MQRWQISRALLVAAFSVSTTLPLYAQDWRDDGPPPLIERLPPVDAEPDFATGALDESEFADREPVPPIESPLPRKRIASNDGPMGQDRSPYHSKVYWLPSQNLRSQPGDWSQSGEQKGLSLPIYVAPEGGNIWLATANVERMEISTSAILPDSKLAVPDELWKISVGAMHFRTLDNGWKTGAILTVGTASDEPFDGLRDMTTTAIGFLSVPTGERDAWNFSLFYSPTSQLPFPIPGVAYVWRPSDELTANIGVPFSLQYRPTETFSIAASYMPLTNINILARQQLDENWCLYGGYQVTNDTYWLADRIENQERFYLFDQRLTLGLDRKLFWGLSLDFSAGYVFDRQVFQAKSFSGERLDELTIDPGVVGTLQLMWSR